MNNGIPEFGRDYCTGDVIFTKTPGNVISGAISKVLDVLDDTDFDPSHVLIVQNDKWGIEAFIEGIKWCRLHEIFHGDHKYVIASPGCSQEIRDKIVNCSLNYYGRPYDVTGLILGFPLQLVTKLSVILPPLRKIPVPFHMPGAFVCSAFVAQVFKDTGCFNHVKLLNEWHTTRITPAMLLRDFPWRFKDEYSAVPSTDKPDTGRGLTADATRPDNPYHDWPAVDEPDDVDIPIHDDGKGKRCGLNATAPDADDGWKSNSICAECTERPEDNRRS